MGKVSTVGIHRLVIVMSKHESKFNAVGIDKKTRSGRVRIECVCPKIGI